MDEQKKPDAVVELRPDASPEDVEAFRELWDRLGVRVKPFDAVTTADVREVIQILRAIEFDLKSLGSDIGRAMR